MRYQASRMYISNGVKMKCEEFESMVDGYVDGTIPESAAEDFEAHYFECDNCFYTLKATELLYENKVRIPIKEKRNILFVFKPAIALASLVIIIYSSLFYLDTGNRERGIERIASFDPPLFIKAENRGVSGPGDFYTAMEMYNRAEYKEAYKLISSIDKNNPRLWFFRGVLALLNDDNRAAVRSFEKIIGSMDPSYYDEAIYYRGIGYLKMKRIKEALKDFRILETMFSPLSAKASEKIRQISEL